MGSVTQPLHVLFFPFLATGHMNPMMDMVKLFSSQGVKATILTTPANAPLIQPTIDRANQYANAHYHLPITIVLILFPSVEAGLPDGCENCSSIPSPDLQPNFLRAIAMLRQPFDKVLTDLAPDCVITDMFFPWTSDVAAEHGLPRLIFYGTSFFASCAIDSIGSKSLESTPPDADSLVLPGLPHRIEMLRTQIVDLAKTDAATIELFEQIHESESRSYGVVVNSFYELEPDYVKHYHQKAPGRKAWAIGPVSLCNEDELDMSRRGNMTSIDCHACMKWLETKAPGSVVYMCFGSMSRLTNAQLREIAFALEASNHPFIWVVRSSSQDWVPQGYEKRIQGRGLLIRGWAPQVLILNHQAVGGFVTHCGWNSCLEGVSAGVPLVTWPLFAEQFYNERMMVDVLKIGVSLGVKDYSENEKERALVEAAEIERAVNELMRSGEDAERRRNSARELKGKAKRAVEEGGSSYTEMGSLIKQLKDLANERANQSHSKIP